MRKSASNVEFWLRLVTRNSSFCSPLFTLLLPENKSRARRSLSLSWVIRENLLRKLRHPTPPLTTYFQVRAAKICSADHYVEGERTLGTLPRTMERYKRAKTWIVQNLKWRAQVTLYPNHCATADYVLVALPRVTVSHCGHFESSDSGHGSFASRHPVTGPVGSEPSILSSNSEHFHTCAAPFGPLMGQFRGNLIVLRINPHLHGEEGFSEIQGMGSIGRFEV